MEQATRICDLSRSYVRWEFDTRLRSPVTVSHPPSFTFNHVRVRADCVAEVTERGTGRRASYLLGASCKTEHVNVESGIWVSPNADFCLIAGSDRCLAIKRWDRTEKGVMLHPPTLGPQPERQLVKPSEAFTRYSVSFRTIEGRLVEKPEELAAVLDSEAQLFCRTRIEAERYSLVLEYPALTVNVSAVDGYCQVDTGPVIIPNLAAKFSEVLESFQLAYIAHLRRDWSEFLVCVPTPVSPEISVHHYSKSVRVECVNEFVAVP